MAITLQNHPPKTGVFLLNSDFSTLYSDLPSIFPSIFPFVSSLPGHVVRWELCGHCRGGGAQGSGLGEKGARRFRRCSTQKVLLDGREKTWEKHRKTVIPLLFTGVINCYKPRKTWQCNRRKFRSETSDNMDSWKAEVKRVRREKIRRKKR